MTTWRRVAEPAREIAWLVDSEVKPQGIGYDPGRWESFTWVLHAMYESPVPSADRPTPVRPWYGPAAIPPGWERLLWAEDLGRNGRELDVEDPDFPGEWLEDGPTITHGPPEGTLDETSWRSLVQALAQELPQGAAAPCLAYIDSWSALERQGNVHIWAGPLGDITTLVLEGHYQFSPTNWWPEDRSWFVHTDYDEFATKLSGNDELVAAVERQPALETIRWTGPGGRGGRTYEEWRRANPHRRQRPLP